MSLCQHMNTKNLLKSTTIKLPSFFLTFSNLNFTSIFIAVVSLHMKKGITPNNSQIIWCEWTGTSSNLLTHNQICCAVVNSLSWRSYFTTLFPLPGSLVISYKPTKSMIFLWWWGDISSDTAKECNKHWAYYSKKEEQEKKLSEISTPSPTNPSPSTESVIPNGVDCLNYYRW